MEYYDLHDQDGYIATLKTEATKKELEHLIKTVKSFKPTDYDLDLLAEALASNGLKYEFIHAQSVEW